MNLTCDVESGKPPALMEWKNRNVVVATGGPASLIYTFIPNVTNHLQSLMCIAFNNVTRITLTKRVTLHLYFEPTVKIIPSGHIHIIENEALLLDCNYTSNDNWNTSVIWKYTTDGHITYTANKKLKLDNIKRNDAGHYTCFVSNSAGEAEDSVIVNVLYPPRTPANIKAFTQSDIILVKWTADYDIGLQKTIFVEYRKHYESRWNQVSAVNRSTVIINGLDPGTIYLLRLYSTTAGGESNKTDEIIVKTGSRRLCPQYSR
ncbi:unnamed protein product [Mytilus coruscus]|uniref:Uncharacterized protein n=1 Tax=Mytilus coruscus TaxID=42192 RepID=A0A6J8F3K7_MYTCO|nr:unnamed protein product [Mytilus coruscus]